MSLSTVTLADIERAAQVIEGAVARTPTAPSRTISEICGCEIVLKFENLQYRRASRSAARSTG